MSNKGKLAFWRKGFFIIIAIAILGVVAFLSNEYGNRPIIAADSPNGPVKRVVVQYKDVAPVATRSNIEARQNAINDAGNNIQNSNQYSDGYKSKVRDYDNIPYAVYLVDNEGEQSLKNNPLILSVRDDTLIEPSMNQVLTTLGGTTAGFTDAQGTYNGSGVAVAILDTGARTTHTMISGKVVAEACFGVTAVYSDATLTSLCSGAAESVTGAGASSYACGVILDACHHGTHVTSIAAGVPVVATIDGSPANLSGVASGADIVSIQVFNEVDSTTLCPVGANPCLLAFDSNIAAAVDYIINLVNNNTIGEPIVAANMSLGGGAFSDHTTCDAASPIYVSTINLLRSHNIAPIVANGNSGDTSGNENKLAAPACVTGAIAVGATNKAGNTIASYSQNGPLTTLLAPGGDYDGVSLSSMIWAASYTSDTNLESEQGTSMAAPVVTGAFAVFREKHPNATIDQIVSALQSSGVNITEARSGYTPVVKKRVALASALSSTPLPTISSFTGPSGVVNEGGSMTVSGQSVDSTSCSLDHGIGLVTLTSGGFTTTVPAATTYTLTCKNSFNDTVTSVLNTTLNAAPTQPVLGENNFDSSTGTLVVNWGPSSDSDGVDGYQIYLDGQLVDTVLASELSYTLQNIDASLAHTLEIRAIDSLGAISSALSISFGNVASQVVTVPNTGFLINTIITNSWTKLILLAGLTIIILVGTAYIIHRTGL